jgi:hypothetical protein
LHSMPLSHIPCLPIPGDAGKVFVVGHTKNSQGVACVSRGIGLTGEGISTGSDDAFSGSLGDRGGVSGAPDRGSRVQERQVMEERCLGGLCLFPLDERRHCCPFTREKTIFPECTSYSLYWLDSRLQSAFRRSWSEFPRCYFGINTHALGPMHRRCNSFGGIP